MKSIDLARRDFVRLGIASSLGVCSSGWLPSFAAEAASSSTRRRQCILLWMSGGPSQIDTFDMKPNHANGGEFKEIQTRSPGLRISEHFPLLAEQSEALAVVRSVSTKEGDHQRGTYLMRTGQRPGMRTPFPCIGASLAKSLDPEKIALPNYFSINPQVEISPDAFSSGFLGPRYAAATVDAVNPQNAGPPNPNGSESSGDGNGFADLRVENLLLPEVIGERQLDRRLELWNSLQADYLQQRASPIASAHNTVYRRAMEMMRSRDIAAFDLSDEPQTVRESYGRGAFGQGCLMARRLIERGVPVVEVTLGMGLSWDTHQDNFANVRRLSQDLDRGWGTLLADLKQRGLLETTTILWMGEFGRTPVINEQSGRDHFPNAWTCVFAGGGIQGGQAYGKTSDDGREVAENQVSHGDVLATLCEAVGVDPETENVTAEGRPHKIAEGNPIRDILA